MDLKSWNCYLEELVGAVERRKPVDPSQDPQFIDVKSLIKQQKTLDPQLWDNEKLKPEIVITGQIILMLIFTFFLTSNNLKTLRS